MLVVDDSKMKLLRMKEKLLEVSFNSGTMLSNEKLINEYASLVKEIDEEVFKAYLEKINNTNYRNLDYPKQLEWLLDIKQEYNDVLELQCEFRNTYQKYSDRKLELSNLSDILIDVIDERINNIQGYLINTKQLDKNKAELEELSLKLVKLEKMRGDHKERFISMEHDLKYDFINAEGRKLVDGKPEYTSVIKEYSDNGYDLRRMLSNIEELEALIDEAETSKNAAEEKLVAAKICYDNLPSLENKEVYETIVNDMLKARYHLALLNMAKLIGKEENDYFEMARKREEIKALNSVRVECLNKMGIRFAIDPFYRSKLDMQYTAISGYENISEDIDVIRKKMANLTTLKENRESSNAEFIIALNTATSFIRNDTSFEEIKQEVKPEVVVAKNKVVSIRDVSQDLNMTTAMEKVNSVIRRVNAFFNNKEDKNEAPTLVIEENLSANEIFPEETEEDIKIDTTPSDLFIDVEPFEQAKLFSEKTDDAVFPEEKKMIIDLKPDKVVNESSVSQAVPEMPDAFWVTKDDKINAVDSDAEPSFDEQIDKLINSNDTRRKK